MSLLLDDSENNVTVLWFGVVGRDQELIEENL